MSNPPTRRAILSLYHSTLKTSQSFSSYNFRNYFIRQTKDTFRAIQVRRHALSWLFSRFLLLVQAESDPSRVQSMYAEAVRELSVLRRSAIVNQLYGGWRLAVEDKKPEMFRADS